ncbi:HEAT repeat domain-containing protein [Actinoplanes sp. GCM10030250]|uniref:HEAT repeat domain-containing protein n=1 Tax=Actinoplanes sp. GCM10030250 TaxID=3273376 RepID=UPI003607CB33
MADLVHLTLERNARRVIRSGIAARSHGWFGDRGVYCMPVLPSFTLTHQWVRELRRWKPGVHVAVHLRVPDDEIVTVGHYGREPQRVPLARAVAVIREAADPRGFEIFVPRAVGAGEVRRIRDIPQGVGWRFKPGAHGRRPCACPACLASGTPGAGRLRRRFPYEDPLRPKPEVMAELRAATTSEQIIEALNELGRRSRGGAEELEFLVEHPDSEVREVLFYLLERYRGRVARELRDRLGFDDDDDEEEEEEEEEEEKERW